MKLYIGIDVGGTRINAALAGADGDVSVRAERSTDRAGGARAGLATIAEVSSELLAAAERLDATVERIGIGFGGPVDAKGGIVRLSHHVQGWENVALASIVREATGVETLVENDCNTAALGEWRFGAGRGIDDLIYLNIGTGIGGGVVSGGRLLGGAGNAAGEIGHMTIDPGGPVCTCGRRGCLEALCSGPAIARRAREAAARGDADSQLTGESTAEDVFRLAAEGDSLARAIVDRTADHLAHAIGNAAVLLNPRLVVLGGGVADAGDILLDAIRARLEHYLLPIHLNDFEIVKAALGYEAGVLGAVALAAYSAMNEE